MKIGLIGADLNSSNKGCEALAYAFLEILNNLAYERGIKAEVVLVKKLPTKKWMTKGFSLKKISGAYIPKKEYSNLSFRVAFCFHTKRRIFFPHLLKSVRYVIDFTGGDSFSDIYGKDRFYSRTYLKASIIKHNIPLILGSQTIGPFKDKKVEAIAAKVISDCREVFARDEISCDYAFRISGRCPVLTTDVAFALPFHKEILPDSDKIRIGINLSGLLWNGGYTGDNQFGLTCDYQQYCRKLISSLTESGKYEIHLIPHAFKEDLQYTDNDLIPITILHKEFPETIVSPHFDFCIDAKSYIAAMDVFTGARMHSTIGAFSSGVPVIPFSYSRKFEGMFSALHYPYVIEAAKWDTEMCVKKTVEWINHYTLLRDDMDDGRKITENRLGNFTDRLTEILFEER